MEVGPIFYDYLWPLHVKSVGAQKMTDSLAGYLIASDTLSSLKMSSQLKQKKVVFLGRGKYLKRLSFKKIFSQGFEENPTYKIL